MYVLCTVLWARWCCDPYSRGNPGFGSRFSKRLLPGSNKFSSTLHCAALSAYCLLVDICNIYILKLCETTLYLI